MTRFVLISQARSGSTMLGTALASHPQVLMHGEVFGAGHFPLNFYGIDENLPWPTPLELYLKRMRDTDPQAFLDQMVFAATARSAVGLKFKFEEFALWPAVKAYIADNGIPIIFIRRRNLLSRYLSEVEAIFTGLFNNTDKTSSGPVTAASLTEMLSLDAVRQAIDTSRAHEEGFRAFFKDSRLLELSFEEFLADWAGPSRRICEFLGIVDMILVPGTEQRPARRLIDDYFDRSALRAALHDLGYEASI